MGPGSGLQAAVEVVRVIRDVLLDGHHVLRHLVAREDRVVLAHVGAVGGPVFVPVKPQLLFITNSKPDGTVKVLRCILL